MATVRLEPDLLARLGVEFDLDDGDLIESVLAIAKVVKGDGTVEVVLGVSQGLQWLEQLGMVDAADDMVRDNIGGEDDD